jgi:hypothetical protein
MLQWFPIDDWSSKLVHPRVLVALIRHQILRGDVLFLDVIGEQWQMVMFKNSVITLDNGVGAEDLECHLQTFWSLPIVTRTEKPVLDLLTKLGVCRRPVFHGMSMEGVWAVDHCITSRYRVGGQSTESILNFVYYITVMTLEMWEKVDVTPNDERDLLQVIGEQPRYEPQSGASFPKVKPGSLTVRLNVSSEQVPIEKYFPKKDVAEKFNMYDFESRFNHVYRGRTYRRYPVFPNGIDWLTAYYPILKFALGVQQRTDMDAKHYLRAIFGFTWEQVDVVMFRLSVVTMSATNLVDNLLIDQLVNYHRIEYSVRLPRFKIPKLMVSLWGNETFDYSANSRQWEDIEVNVKSNSCGVIDQGKVDLVFW